MHFLFLGVFQKQLEIFHNTTYAPRGRLKAFQSMLEEADKNKNDNQDKVRDTLKKEAVMLFDVCAKTLKSYDDHSSSVNVSPPSKHKPDFKLSSEVEDILVLLQRLFHEFPENKITEISGDDFYRIVYNVLRPSISDRYKIYGFFLLTNYMNLLRKNKATISENLYTIFECSFPYHEVPDEGLVMRKKIPLLMEQPINERWVQCLVKESGEIKNVGLIKNYFQIIYRLIEADTGTSVFWLELMKKAWLKYLYPKIYQQFLTSPIEAVGSSSPDLDPDTIGYHPLCPPVAHTMVCKVILRVLKLKELEDVRNERYRNKESFFFVLEVLAQTFMLFAKKGPVYAEYYKSYMDIKREFLKYLRELLSGYNMPKQLESVRHEIYMKAVSCAFSLFNSSECLAMLQKEEFAELINSIDTCLRHSDYAKHPDSFQSLSLYAFDTFLLATEKTQVYLEEQKKGGYFTSEAQVFLTFTEGMIQHMFTLCLNPAAGSDSKIWDKMKEFCRKYLGTQMLILVWQSSIFEATSNLSDALSHIPEDEFKVLNEPVLNPFEGLPMKKEYALQVLFDAFTSTDDDQKTKYKEVIEIKMYKTFELWMKLLKLLQIPGGFANVLILTEYVRTLHGVIDMLVPFDKMTKRREGKEHSSISTFPPPNSTIFDIFGAYLFGLCQGNAPDLVDVRNFTLKTICRVFCTNQCEVPLPIGYLAHMVRIISSALVSRVRSTISIVIQHTKPIFTLDYRGMLVLIPLYTQQIKVVLEPDSGFSSKAKSAAVSILASLLSIPDHYDEYEIPPIFKGGPVTTMPQVKQAVYDEVLMLLHKSIFEPAEDKMYHKMVNKAICCATVIVYQEASKAAPHSDTLKKYVAGIVAKAMETSVAVQGIALSCLCSLSYLFPIFDQCDKEILNFIFSALSDRLYSLSFEKTLDSAEKQAHVANLLNALLELIMEDRYGALTKTREIFMKIVDSAQRLSKSSLGEVRDDALMLVEFVKEYYMNYPLRGQSAAVTSSLFDEIEFYSLKENTIKNFHRSFQPRRRSASHCGDEKSGTLLKKAAADSIGMQPSQPIHRVPSIEEMEGKHSSESGSARFYEMLKKASPIVTQYLSGGNGEKDEKIKRAETAGNLTPGELKEVEDFAVWKSKTIHLGYGSEAIISIIQSPYLSSRIIVRDLTGKHAWLITEHRVLDYNCLNTIDYNDKAAVYKNVLNLKGDKKLKEIITENKAVVETSKEEETAKVSENVKLTSLESPEKIEEELKRIHDTDTLTRVLTLLSKHCSDVKLFENLLENLEKQELAQNAKEISEFQAKASKLEEAEQILYKLSEAERKAKCEEEFKAEVRSLDKAYQADPSRIDHALAFLTHIGNLNILPSPSTTPQLTLLNENDPDFRMLIKFLDNECALRRSIKLGVIYVERGQFDQKSILYNTKGSAKYEELLRNLGKPLSKKDAHRSLSLQPDILYYATAIYELVFHVITLMATNFNDAQQLEKKKYVGNDSVHIVWNENDREYKPGTITGAFNFAHLIVYPLRNGLYKIRVEKKKDAKKELVKFFGPLLTGMVLPMDVLPALLRYTAINARKSITFKQLQMFNPMSERRKTIEKIMSKYAVQSKSKSDQQFMLIDKLMHSIPK